MSEFGEHADTRRIPDNIIEKHNTPAEILQVTGNFLQIVGRIDCPRDYVMEGIGWLAREGKISIRDEGRVPWSPSKNSDGALRCL